MTMIPYDCPTCQRRRLYPDTAFPVGITLLDENSQPREKMCQTCLADRWKMLDEGMRHALLRVWVQRRLGEYWEGYQNLHLELILDGHESLAKRQDDEAEQIMLASWKHEL